MKYFIIVGERSGDVHGANLVKALKEHDPQGVFQGYGGDAMARVGVSILVHYKELAVMGFLSLLSHLFKLLRYLRLCKKAITQFQPDVVILIDFGGFNMRMAKFAHQNGYKVYYYIVPKIWAWHQSRAWKLKKTVDRMFVILPFEKDFYQRFGIDVDYVGSPVADAIRQFQPDETFRSNHNISEDQQVVALLPGSRTSEVKRILPLMEQLCLRHPHIRFLIAGVSNLDATWYGSFDSLPNVTVIFERSYDILSVANAAVVTSGTATLETALLCVPQVVVYKTTSLEAFIVRRIIQVSYIGLVNLILDKLAVKELIQEEATVDRMESEMKMLLEQSDYRKQIIMDYHTIQGKFRSESASHNAAKLMWNYLQA